MTDLTGKRVLITGGAIRAGAYLCRLFASRHAHVLIHCRQSAEAAEELCKSIGGTPSADICFCDLTDTKAAVRMIEDLKPVDILINNAAAYVRSNMAQKSPEDGFRQFTVNFFTPVELIRAFARQNAEDLAVVNVADCMVNHTDPESFSYSLSKKMLVEATKAAALAFAPKVRVNAVAPGPMIPPEYLKDRGMRKTLERIPSKRRVDPEDFAETVLFAAVNRSMTGSVLTVDCGMSLL